jgi:hypothetical protein
VKLLFVFASAFLLAACRSVNPPAPAVSEESIPLPPVQPSRISLPVKIRLDSYLALADKQVDRVFEGSDSPCSGVSYNYRFERDPLDFSGSGRNVDAIVTGKYRIRMSYCPECTGLFTDEPFCLTARIPFSCGYNEPMRRVSIRFSSSFSLTSDYGIRTQTKVSEVKALDPCEVTVFRFDATEKLLQEIRKALGTLATDIDKQTAKLSLKSEAAGLWKTISSPVPVPGYGYVHFNPAKITVSQPVLMGKELSCALEMEASPLFSSYSQGAPPKPLPPLTLTESPLNDTLVLFSEMRLNYDSLSATVNLLISGTELQLKGNTIRIDSISIRGPQNKKLVFRMKFSGDKKGTLYVNGIPKYDAALQTIELTDIEFDVETRNLLLRSAKWLFNDRILEEITRSSRQDLRPQLDRLRSTLNKSLKMEMNGFRLSGNVHQLKVDGVYPELTDLVVRLSAKGKLLVSTVD